MGLLRKKRGPDVVDLTKLEKKGILQRSKEIAERNKEINSSEFVDLRSNISRSNGAANSSPFAFLDNLASAGSNVNLEGNTEIKNFHELKIKMEDIEYKIEKFIERLEKIEERLGKL